jgi:hypothetical protein
MAGACEPGNEGRVLPSGIERRGKPACFDASIVLITRLDLGSNPGRRGEKAATNSLNCGKAQE